jgi:alginate O-acetyltransferase complex protein AlgI
MPFGLVVMVGWVLFRADTFSYGLSFLAALSGWGHGDGIEYRAGLYLDTKLTLTLVVGVVSALPVLPFLRSMREWALTRCGPREVLLLESVFAGGSVITLSLIFLSSAMALTAGSYNPFIYFRF